MKRRLDKKKSALPAKFKNALRGSRSIIHTFAWLRATVQPNLYSSVIATMPSFPYQGRSILPEFGTHLAQFSTRLPLPNPIPLEKECLWAANLLISHADGINVYLAHRTKLEKDFLIGNINECSSTLTQMELDTGFSLYFLEMKTAVLQNTRGLEAQKTFSSEIRNRAQEQAKEGLIPAFSFFISWRNEDTTNPLQFKKDIAEKSSEWEISEDLRSYLLFRILPDMPVHSRHLALLLRYEESYSAIDLYESFIRLAGHSIISDLNKLGTHFIKPLEMLVETITDFRLQKLLFLATGEIQYLKNCQPRSLLLDEFHIGGNYEAIIEHFKEESAKQPADIWIPFLLAIAEQELGAAAIRIENVKSRIGNILRRLIDKPGRYSRKLSGRNSFSF